ncbi:hypothetical protein [Pseudomonas sp. Irchel 3E20]|uniref:hypothetical protein n=1 Tax=Pseudomonas sp. Irchel 3E20 TaxID=2008983 RepID=UPI001595266F|nr:hypothetical protein [Pseudomonas sp. Irchel 3E20]
MNDFDEMVAAGLPLLEKPPEEIECLRLEAESLMAAMSDGQLQALRASVPDRTLH